MVRNPDIPPTFTNPILPGLGSPIRLMPIDSPHSPIRILQLHPRELSLDLIQQPHFCPQNSQGIIQTPDRLFAFNPICADHPRAEDKGIVTSYAWVRDRCHPRSGIECVPGKVAALGIQSPPRDCIKRPL